MKSLVLGFCCFLFCGPLLCAAGSNTSLAKNQIVFLRGMEAGKELHFDARGNLLGAVEPGSFAYSAIKIKKIRKTAKELDIQGERVALISQTASEPPHLSDIIFAQLNDPLEITIALDRSQPRALDEALQKVFVLSLRDALAEKSPDVARAELESLASTALQEDYSKEGFSDAGSGIRKVGPDVTPPKLIYSVTPVYPKKLGKKNHIQGLCVLSLIVDASGRPEHVRLVRSIEPTLDANAIAAVGEYRFKPATYQGKPVPVIVDIAVNFRIR